MDHRFYKEKGTWYIDLPKFLEQGLGTKANLMMVAGADTLLDKLAGYDFMNAAPDGTSITLKIDTEKFDGYDVKMYYEEHGKDQDTLDRVGHAPVEYGAYYVATELFGMQCKHQLWLCPVTEYVLGSYPSIIYAKKIG